ncbi:hypothetical protein [Bacillus paranthracis]|uniref:hypothetical protein n=1 Tax=Bacillus paranthracis TaxID=2026186 RepID=UPI0022E2B6C4|nr:hypothetical protein [Bacillus paranthracis]
MGKQYYKTFQTKGIIEFVPYGDTPNNSYKHIVERAVANGKKQVIFTTSIFKDLISRIYNEKLNLMDLKFMEPLEIYDFKDVGQLINQINISKGNKILIKSLLETINWVVNDESIDIKSITIGNQGTKRSTDLFSNGVLCMDTEEFEVITNDIIKPVLQKYL